MTEDRSDHPGAHLLAITPSERDALRRELCWYGGALGDLEMMADRGMLERSWERDVRWRANIALWLLDDLGWQHVDPRDEFYLTLPAHELAHWLLYTLQQADAMCEEQRGVLMDAETSARNHHSIRVEAGEREVPSVVELTDENRDSASRALDEMLDLRLVATALLERLEAR